MNVFIKRSIKVVLAIVFIGAAVVPACAQGKKGLVKGVGSALSKKMPTVAVKAPTVRPFMPSSLPKIGIPASNLPSVPKNIGPSGNSMLIKVAPKRVVPSDAQVRLGIQRQIAQQVPLEDLTSVQTINALYLMSKNTPDGVLTYGTVLGEKIQQIISNPHPSFELTLMLPFLKTLLATSGTPAKSFVELEKAYKTYPNNVELNEFGFPKKNSVNVDLESYLLAADPAEMGAFIAEPNRVEVAGGRTGLFLTEQERAAAETLMNRRLERAAIPLESSPREVLQVAYNYFATQQTLSKDIVHDIDFTYRYRSDLPFEELTAAEKEAFIVHKLIRYQLEHNSHIENSIGENVQLYITQSVDLAHLQLLDYVASKNAYRALRTVDGNFYNTTEGLRTALKAYQALSAASYSYYINQNLLKRDVVKYAEKWFDWDFFNVSQVQVSSPETIRELYPLLPVELQNSYQDLQP